MAAVEGTVVDVRMRRRLRDRSSPEALAKVEGLRERRLALESRLRQMRAKSRRTKAELGNATTTLKGAVEDLAREAGWGRGPADGMAEGLVGLADERRALMRRLIAERAETSRCQEDLQRLVDREQAEAGIEDVVKAWIEVDIAADGELTLEVDYVVGCAAWRPWHRAELDETAGTIEVATDACVWQRTGEDWSGVRLELSTERPSLGTRPPELMTDELRVRPKSEQVLVETRARDVEVAGLGAGDRTSERLPGIDDAGDARTITAPAAAHVPSDGRPHRIPLTSFAGPADISRVVVGEFAQAVVVEATQTHSGAQPLLAGPVDLIRNHGLVGRTSLRYVAPGERFALGFGPDAGLRVRREVEDSDVETRRLSSWRERRRRVRIRISNVSADTHEVVVRERVPVSELDKVKVSVLAADTTDRATPDADGLLSWTVALPAHEQADVELTWELRAHEDVRGLPI